MKAAVCVLVCSILLICAPASFGQVSGKTNPASTSTLSGGINLRSIAGVPFSADVARESTQLLPDGSRTLIETHGKMFRDAEGRTRVETELATGTGLATRHFITIVDPVQHVSIVLNVEAKTATIFHLPPVPAASDKQLKLVAAAQAHGSGAKRSIASLEDLGSMTMEGFTVTGTRSTHPADASAAKDKAQIAITESWFSSELKVELLAITQLPQAVTQSTRPINIMPGVPDPALFQAPAGYAVQDHSQPK
jgi:hypothetical protein